MPEGLLVIIALIFSVICFVTSLYLTWVALSVARDTSEKTAQLRPKEEGGLSRGTLDLAAGMKAIGELVSALSKAAPYLSYLIASIIFLSLALYGNGTLTQPFPSGEKTEVETDQGGAQSEPDQITKDEGMNLPVE